MRYRNSLPFSIGELRDLHGSLVSVVYQPHVCTTNTYPSC